MVQSLLSLYPSQVMMEGLTINMEQFFKTDILHLAVGLLYRLDDYSRINNKKLTIYEDHNNYVGI